MKSTWRAAVAMVGVMLGASVARAGVIQYTVTDLPDVNPGEDLWQYSYSVSGVSFLSGQGFDVYFTVADGFQFGDLVSPQLAPSSDWDALGIQADPSVPADGLFDAVASVDSPSLAGTFTSTFIWRGTGTPGAQKFELFDSDFSVFETGTTAAAPEPATGLLALSMVAGLGLWRSSRRVPVGE